MKVFGSHMGRIFFVKFLADIFAWILKDEDQRESSTRPAFCASVLKFTGQKRYPDFALEYAIEHKLWHAV